MAEAYEVSRQTIYDIGAAGEQVLLAGLVPGPHGPQLCEKTIRVDRNRLARSAVVLTGEGVSQRGIARCLAEMLDTALSPSWVNGELAQVEAAATTVNASWQPAVNETLAGDEIYANGLPNLLLVGNDSLYIYALTRQAACDGDTWGCVLLDAPVTPQFASDAGKGLAAGAQSAELAIHQLDWDHLLRPLWGQAMRLERQALAALEQVEARVAKFDQSHSSTRLAQHFAAWERLHVDAEEKIARYDAFLNLARQVDAQFALIDLTNGQVRDPVAGAESLRAAGEQLQAWEGRIYEKLSTNLVNWAEALFSYHPVLDAALAPLRERWGTPAIQALSCIWQLEATEKRHPLPVRERQAQRVLWAESLDKAAALLEPDQLWLAWEAVWQTLGRSWRGSMLAECVNSLLRPVLDGRKHTDQGCLELFRFWHNVQPFERGKRAGYSPAQLVGLDVPDDVLTLLGLDSKQRPLVNEDTSASPHSPSPYVADFVPLNLLLADHALEYQEVSI